MHRATKLSIHPLLYAIAAARILCRLRPIPDSPLRRLQKYPVTRRARVALVAVRFPVICSRQVETVYSRSGSLHCHSGTAQDRYSLERETVALICEFECAGHIHVAADERSLDRAAPRSTDSTDSIAPCGARAGGVRDCHRSALDLVLEFIPSTRTSWASEPPQS